jgi:hypothetical protein
MAHHKRISHFRRQFVAKSSHKIFVMNELLVEHFSYYFEHASEKCQSIQFGLPNQKQIGDVQEIAQAVEFITASKSHLEDSDLIESNVLVTFCAGTPDNEKYLHFDHLEWLISAAQSANYHVIAIVAGEFNRTKRGRELKSQYSKNPNILFFDHYTEFSDEFVDKYIDFYWRAYSDLSVPYTIYEAISLLKPIMCLKTGFLAELVSKSQIGPVISMNEPVATIKKAFDSINNRVYHSHLMDCRKNATWVDLKNKL